MLIALGVGTVIGIVLVITALKMTMNTEPQGCIIFFGLLLSVFLWIIIIIFKSVLVS